MITFLRLHEAHPPLFYALMRLWLSVAGKSDAAALALPITLGATLVPTIYLIGKSLFSKLVGLVAAALAALSPALSEHSALVRPYSFLPLVGLVSVYALIRGVEHGRARVWFLYTLSAITLLYTHHWAWVVLAGHWVATAVVASQPSFERRNKLVREWFIVQSLIAFAYLPWVTTLLYQVQHGGHGPLVVPRTDIPLFIGQALQGLLQSTVLGYVPMVEPGSIASSTPIFAIAMLALGVGGLLLRDALPRSPFREAELQASRLQADSSVAITMLLVIPVAAWIVAAALSVHSNMLLPRGLVILSPPLILALAYWVARPRDLFTVPFIAAVAGILGSYIVGLDALDRSPRSNARELATAVAQRTTSSDLVIITPEWYSSSLNRYFSSSVAQIDFPHFDRIGAVDYLDIRSRTADPAAFGAINERIELAWKNHQRVWLICPQQIPPSQNPEAIAQGLASRNYVVVGVTRATQIYSLILGLYGPADTTLIGSSRPSRDEYLYARLFSRKTKGL